MVFSVCFLNYPCNNKIPRFFFLQMSRNWNMIFSRIFKNIWHWEHTRGGNHLTTRVQGAPYPPGRAPASWAPRGPSPLTPAPTHSFLQKNHHLAQTHVLAHLAAIFDLFAQSSIHKTALGDCSSVCDYSNGLINFCSSALLIANFCCLGDPVLELACQIYMVKSSFNAWYSLWD